MPSLAGRGDRIVLPSGRTSTLARPSNAWPQTGPRSANLLDGRAISYRNLAIEQPWVSIAVNGIARQISRLPLKVFRSGENGRERDRTSPEAKALARPGRRRTPAHLKYAIACGLLIDGNHVEEKITVAGKPRLRALDWRWLVPYIIDGEVIGWDYRPPQGESRELDPLDVIHYSWETRDGLGVSPLESLGITLRSEDASQRWAEANFRNGTYMGVAVIMDPQVKQDVAKRDAIREEIDGRFTGVDNAGRSVILGGGVQDVKDVGKQTPVEAALIAQRKLNREEVLGVYNWPPPIAGDLEHGTFSNVAELAKIIYKIVLPPWTGLIQETTTLQLINPAGDPDEHYSEFDYNGVLQGDPIQRMQAYRLGLNAGVLTLNDARDSENLPRFDDDLADEPMLLGNNIKPLAQIVAEAANAGAGDVTDPDTDPDVDPDQ